MWFMIFKFSRMILTLDNSKSVTFLWINSECKRLLVFNNNDLEIVNIPLAFYLIQYDSYGTIIADTNACFFKNP